MGRKNNKKAKAGGGAAVAKESSSIDNIDNKLSDLFKTLPPIKRSDLTKVPRN